MIEKYYSDPDTRVLEVKDNGVSFTFTCGVPESGQTSTITLSDLRVADALGIDPKAYSREAFVKTVSQSFPLAYGRYFIKEWDFPIPDEWKADAKMHIATAMESKMLTAIDASYILTIEPPLFALYLLREIQETYIGMPSLGAFPDDLYTLLAKPGKLFEDKIIQVED